MQFEVRIPHKQNPQQFHTVKAEGPNWLFALRDSLTQVGESIEMRNIIC